VETRLDEVADGIVRVSTYIPDLAGLTFNQFILRAEEPLLFHTGMAPLFPLVAAAIGRVLPLESLRWIAFGHVEADECGALGRFLDACPRVRVAHSVVGCGMSLGSGPVTPVPLSRSTPLDLGGKRLRTVPTPHVPHGWDAHVLYEETSRALLCGDLLAHGGDGPATVGEDQIERIVEAAVETERELGSTACTPSLATCAHELAALEPRALALMHGSTILGDGRRALQMLAHAFTTAFDQNSDHRRNGRLWDDLERSRL